MAKTLTADAVVIGCGVIGAAVACSLAMRGLKVRVFEKEPLPACGSSGKAAGGIRGQFANLPDLACSRYSIEVYENFRDRYLVDPEFKRHGYLFIAHSNAAIGKYRRRVETESALGTGTRMVSADEISALVPGIDISDLSGGTFNADEGFLDTSAVITGFVRAGKGRGLSVCFGEPVEEILVSAGRVTGVKTNLREVRCRAVIACAGPWTGALASAVGVRLPLKPCRRNIFVTGPFPALGKDAPFVVDEEDGFYFRREGDGVIMSAMEIDETADFEPTPDWGAIEGLAEKAARRFPAFADAGFKTAWAGIRTLTPDSRAILGPAGPEGFFVACGLSGHGFCHAPAVGEILADAVGGGHESGLDAVPYAPGRFRA